MKGLFIFLLSALFPFSSTAQDLGNRVDYGNPAVGDYISLDDFITFGCMDEMPDQAKRFDEVLERMRLLGDWKFRLEVHTDCRSTTYYNDSISQAKADTFQAFFISRGFPAWRLEAKGMGERMLYLPQCSCERTDAGNLICQEKEHQLNRRTLIRLVERITWKGNEPFSMDFPSPGQFRLFPITENMRHEEITDVRIAMRELVGSIPEAYVTIHYFPGRVSLETYSYRKRKETYYDLEEERTFSKAPSRIGVVHHRYGQNWGNMRRGYVVVIDSVLNKPNVLAAFGLDRKEGVIAYDLGYGTPEGEDVPWEPIAIGGAGFFWDISTSEKTYDLWIITTEYPAEVHLMHRKKVWTLTQDTTTPDLTLYKDFLKRCGSSGMIGADRVKEVKHKHVSGVNLPCMFILVPKEE